MEGVFLQSKDKKIHNYGNQRNNLQNPPAAGGDFQRRHQESERRLRYHARGILP